MNAQIQIEVRSIYGLDKAYVTSAEHKSPLQALTGRTTLTQRDIECLQRLGFTFKRVMGRSSIACGE